MSRQLFGVVIGAAVLNLAGQAEVVKVSLNPSRVFQTVNHFTASDAWACDGVGLYFNEAEKSRAAQYLFSQKLGEDGNPEGIGLSMWRVNLGAGTLDQTGAASNLVGRKADCFLAADGQGYDWKRCAGQRYFMEQARRLGCNRFLLFSNSAPLKWTITGNGFAGGMSSFAANLRPECYGAFADYLADVTKYFVDEGFGIDYVSPINEPQWTWDGQHQEGSPWRASESYRMHVELDRALAERKLTGTQMLFGEVGDLRFVYEGRDEDHWKGVPLEDRPELLAQKFFDPVSKLSLLGLKSQPRMIGGHAYHSELNPELMKRVREHLSTVCQQYGLEYQQTEWCLLPHFKREQLALFTKDWPENRTDMQVGLLLGRIVFADFVWANATAWGHWKGIEFCRDDSLLTAFPHAGVVTNGGVIVANKLLWSLGNFSLFVRPGFRRVELSGADDLNRIAGVAFVSPDGRRIVAVFVNSSFEAPVLSAALPPEVRARVAKVQVFRTDANMDLGNLRVESDAGLILAPRSITTVVYDLK